MRLKDSIPGFDAIFRTLLFFDAGGLNRFGFPPRRQTLMHTNVVVLCCCCTVYMYVFAEKMLSGATYTSKQHSHGEAMAAEEEQFYYQTGKKTKGAPLSLLLSLFNLPASTRCFVVGKK